MILCIIKKNWNLGGKSLEKIDIFLNMDIIRHNYSLAKKWGEKNSCVFIIFNKGCRRWGDDSHPTLSTEKKWTLYIKLYDLLCLLSTSQMVYFQASIVDSESGKKDDEYQRLQAEIKRLTEDNTKLKVTQVAIVH